MANLVVFQGVEISIPPEVTFTHTDGCLEIDLATGFTGKLILKRSEHLYTKIQDQSMHIPIYLCMIYQLYDIYAEVSIKRLCYKWI